MYTDSGGVLYSVSNQKPGVDTVKCIELTYTGSLDADVKLYTPSTVNASSQYINLTIEKGTSDTAAFPNCGTFTSESTVYGGTLADFAATKNSYANGILAFPGAQTAWAEDDTLVYRFTLSVQDDNAAQGVGRTYLIGQKRATAVTDENIPVRQLARLDALQEVLNMVEVEVGLRLDYGRLCAPPQGIEFVAAAIDPQPALGSAELLGRTGDAGHG